ncbi:MAG: AlpA family phage regulatory protein [Gammaproteobacteria bacterium]|nr:AlpA family phage regulatory protein [Gammaproteobacteria bacterium]
MSRPALTSAPSAPGTYPDEAFFRAGDLEDLNLLPFSRATMWRRIAEGTFPAPIKVSDNVSAWRWGDLRRWLANPTGYRAAAKAVQANGGIQ